jgi:hypothetical protein
MQLTKFWVFLFLILLSCKNIENNDDSKIYSVLINKKLLPIPPPPPPFSDRDEFLSKEKVDSLKRVPIKIAVFPYEIEFSIKNKNGEFLLDNLITHQISDKKIEFNN